MKNQNAVIQIHVNFAQGKISVDGIPKHAINKDGKGEHDMRMDILIVDDTIEVYGAPAEIAQLIKNLLDLDVFEKREVSK